MSVQESSLRTYGYAAVFEPLSEEPGFVVSFPDVPEAISQGDDLVDARSMAADALGVALRTYLELGQPLPAARATGEVIRPDAPVAAKIALIESFRASGLSQSELGRRIGKDEKEVRRLLDVNHATKIGPIQHALSALGFKLFVSVAAAE